MSGVELLRDLIRVDTTNPPGKEAAATELIEGRLARAGLQTRVYESPAGRASLVARLPGPPERSALVLLSHTDVVGVEAERWTRDPFGAEMHENAVWGRGALDMKGVSVMHAEAVAALAASDATSQREVIVCAVADEEAGGDEGTRWLLSEHAGDVGFGDDRPPPEVLGEGAFGLKGILDRPVMPIVVGEKSALWLELRARGDPGHGALPPRRQAAVSLARTVAEVCGYRAPRVHPVMREQLRTLSDAVTGPRKTLFRALASGAGSTLSRPLRRRLAAAGTIGALLADTVTPTQLHAGYKNNVAPGEATASVDCRLLPDTDPDAFLAKLRRRARRHDVSVEEMGRHGGPISHRSSLYGLLADASRQADPDSVVVPSLTAGITDVRYFRALGASGYGWVPLVLTPELLSTIHGHDERIDVRGFERAVDVMTEVVRRAAT